MSYTRRRKLARVAFVTATSFYLSLFPWGGTAEARFTTLQAITRQITPANMLIVLDTSGSMVALPGGLYSTANEVGMDCDNGQNCKPVATAATCYDSTGTTQVSPVQYCSSNAECQAGKCTDGEPCRTTSDCIQPGSTCSGTGNACTTNADCGPVPGWCLSTGGSCTSANPCPTGVCTQSGTSCSGGPYNVTCPGSACSGTSTQKCISDQTTSCCTASASQTLSTCNGTTLYPSDTPVISYGGDMSGISLTATATGAPNAMAYGNMMDIGSYPTDSNGMGAPAAGGRANWYDFNNWDGDPGDIVCGVGTAEGQNLTITCPHGTIQAITYASWGNSTGTCPTFTNGTCNGSNSVSVVQTACMGRTSCTVFGDNSTFGDPCSGVGKHLTIAAVCAYNGKGSGFQLPNDNGAVAVIPAAAGSNIDKALTGTGNFTFSAFIYRTRTEPGAWVSDFIFNRRDTTGACAASGVYESESLVFNDDRLTFLSSTAQCSGGSAEILKAPTAFPTNTWTHVAVSYDHSYLRLYQDGKEVANMPYSRTFASNGEPITLGAQFDKYTGGSNNGYIGCYADNYPTERTLWLGDTGSPPVMGSAYTYTTNDLCKTFCKNKGFPYAGSEDGGQCFCGHKLPPSTSSSCNKACPGNSAQTCGGSNALSVFDSGLGAHFIGCFADSGTSRDLAVMAYANDANSDIESCILTCAGKGSQASPARTNPSGVPYVYAGLNKFGQCWCGNTYGRYGLATGQTIAGNSPLIPSQCNSACKNGTSTTELPPYCGGDWANAVYSIASANIAPSSFGGNNDPVTVTSDYFRGTMDTIRMYNRALTANEIRGMVDKCDPNLCAPSSGNVCCSMGTTTATCASPSTGTVTTNVCQSATVTNTCTLANSNICKITNNTSTPPKMCRQAQTRCVVDTDCTKYAGDTCGPASSRMAVAKRVLKDIISKNDRLLNFGLMTYKQGNYFPYYGGGSTTATSTTQTRFFYKSQLDNWNKYDDKNGPSTSFKLCAKAKNRVCSVDSDCSTISGDTCATTYTLEDSTNNTQESNWYMARTGYTTYEFVSQYSQPWCGLYCAVTDQNNRTYKGVYVGSVYQYTLTTTAPGTTISRACSYTDKSTTSINAAIYTSGTTDYASCSTTATTGNFTYLTPRPDYETSGTGPPISVQNSQCWNSNSTATCGKNCGGRWDAQLSPMIDTSVNRTNVTANHAAVLKNLEWATYGGVLAYGSTPIGCTLYNDNGAGDMGTTPPEQFGAYKYMATIKHGSGSSGMNTTLSPAQPADPIACRTNAVLLVTDGEANGPGDSSCGSAACAAANPISAGCTCRSVLSAYKLRWQQPATPFTTPSADGAAMTNALGAKTYVIGFAADVSSASSKTTLDNIARAGGTSTAYTAVTETELTNAIQNAIFAVIAGSYSTGQASASAGAQSNASGFTTGTMMLDARVDFPSWKGHLIAYETSDATKCPGGVGPVPCLLWDSAAVTFGDSNLDAALDASKPYLSWKSRRIYTSSGKTLVALNDGTGTVPSGNVATLFSLGLGATSSDVSPIAQWMMGITSSTTCSIGGTTCATDTDCSSKITGDTCGRAINPATLGTFTNSTPIDVGPPGISALPGGQDFYNKFKNRPELIYVAADDGMLHAFFARDTTLGSATFKGGSEAFAYIPPQMLKTITNLYAQGGQFPHPDDHLYGVAASPKVKNICVANCTSTATPSTADWRTVLVLGEGQGGNDVMMLDVTNPFSGSGTNPFVATGISSTPVGVMWNTSDPNALPSPPNTTLANSYDAKLGQTLSVPGFAIGKTSGTTYDDYRVVLASGYAPAGYTNFTPTTTGQGLTLVSIKASDGTMLDNATVGTATSTCNTSERTALTDVATAKNNQSGEQGQIVAGFFGDTWGDLWQYVPGTGTGGSTSTTGAVSKIFGFGCQAPLHFSPTVVQLDRDNPGNYANNIFLAQVTNSALDKDTQGFSQSALGILKLLYTGSSVTWDGTWLLDPGSAGLSSNICADTSVSPCTKLSTSARPTSTPIAILKADGTGFELFTAWYVAPSNGCSFGATYLTIHEIQGGGLVVQKLGRKLADQQVTNVVLVGGKAMFLDRNAALQDVTTYLPFSVANGKSAGNPTSGERFKRLGWSELP